MCLSVYYYILEKNLSSQTRLWRDFKSLPVYLPSSLGGLGLPLPVGVILKYFNFEVGFLLNLLREDLPIGEYLDSFYGLKTINAKRKRKIPIPKMEKFFERLKIEIDPQVRSEYDPQEHKFLYSIPAVLKYYKTGPRSGEMDISAVTGEPRVAGVIADVYDRDGFIPIDTIIDQWERYQMFGKTFITGHDVPETLSLRGYLANLKRFWRDAKSRYGIPVNGTLLFEGRAVTVTQQEFDELSWNLSKRSMTLIHKEKTKESLLALGPTMNVSLGRMDPIAQTKLGLEAQLANAINDWLRIQSLEDDREPVAVDSNVLE